MNLIRNKVMYITSYIVCITAYILIAFALFNITYKIHYYYLFALIPMLFLFVVLTFSNTIKLIITIVSMMFGRNDNNEMLEFYDKSINYINRLTKYTLIGIFLTLLFSIMILDIVLCIIKEKYYLIALSIIIFIILFYFIFDKIVKMIKKEIKI